MERNIKIAAVLFDMNGVLIDDERLHKEAFRKVIEKRGLSLKEQDYINHFSGRTDLEGFISFFKETPDDLSSILDEKTRFYSSLASGNLSSFIGVQDFIEKILADTIPIGIVTSSSPAETRMVIETIGLEGKISTVITGEDVKKGKPDPEGYLKAADILKAKPSKCLVIEDAPVGIKAAKKAKMSVMAVTNTHKRKDLAGADIIVDYLRSDLWPLS